MVNMNLEGVSKYLTVEVLDHAFKMKTGTMDDIQSVNVTRAAPAGAGLIGAVYRIEISGLTSSTSFVAKAMAPDPLLRKSFATAKYFGREITFFTEVLPALIEVQKSSGAKERIQNYVPICYGYHCDGENDYILMEDLLERQCTTAAQIPPKPERDAILQTLAHLHAVSFALRKRKPDVFNKLIQNIPELYYTESDRTRYTPYLQNAINFDLPALAEYEDPKTSIFYKKFEKLVTEDPYGQMIALTSDFSEYPTITHGDCWTPNFLLAGNKAVAIDFQLLRCTSPASDLSVLIVLSCCQNGSVKYALDAIKVYYDSLTYYLKDQGIDANEVFPRAVLDEHLRKYGRFGMLAAASTIPLILSDKCDVLQDFGKNYDEQENIPLDKLWQLRPFNTKEEKMMLVNAVRVSVDLGLI